MEEDNIKQEQGKKFNIFKIILLIIISILGIYIIAYTGLIVLSPLIAILLIIILSSIKGNENIIRWIKNIISFIYLGLSIFFWIYDIMNYGLENGSVIGFYFLVCFFLIRCMILLTKPPKKFNFIMLIFIGIIGMIASYIVTIGVMFGIFLLKAYSEEYSSLLVYIKYMWPFIALLVLSLIEGHENIIRWIKNIISFIYLGLTIYSVYEGVTYESRKWFDLTTFGFAISALIYFTYFIFIRLIIFLTKPSVPAKRKKILSVIMGIILIALFLITIF